MIAVPRRSSCSSAEPSVLTFPSDRAVVFVAGPLGIWLLGNRADADGGGRRSVLVALAPHAIDVPRLAALSTRCRALRQVHVRAYVNCYLLTEMIK